MAWTEDRIAVLKAGWEGGMTASQIAEKLGEGVTRNAVIGKAHRLGLESRPSPVKAGEDTSAPAKQAAKPAASAASPPRNTSKAALAGATSGALAAAPAAPPAAAPAATPAVAKPVTAKRPARTGKAARVSLLDLNERICKWPIGHPDDADFHFCGKPVQPTFPYCSEHCLLAYQAQLPRRDRDRRPLPIMPGMPRR